MAQIKVVPTKWDEVLQEYVPIPLDEADAATITLASRLHGQEVTDEQLNEVMMDLCLATDH